MQQQTKNLLTYLIAFLLLLPLFFINIKDTHDWGDDFAQYIHQAKNIVEGVPQSENGYIYNEEYPKLGPPAYPIGFPLMLAPVYYFAGNSITAFLLLITSMLFVTGILLFAYYKKYFSALESILMVLVFVYNPFTLNFKLEIMSEIPFTLILLLSIMLYKSKSRSLVLTGVLTGLAAGMLWSTRSIGVAFLLGVLLDGIKNAWIAHRRHLGRHLIIQAIAKTTLIIFIGIFVYVLLNVILFKVPSGGVMAYGNIFDLQLLKDTVLYNLNYYGEVFLSFMNTDNGKWQFAALVTKTLFFSLLLIGAFNKFVSKPDVVDLTVICYMGILFIYPYTASGFRFLMPVFPYFMIYIVQGFKSISFNLKMKPWIAALLLGILVLLQYRKGMEFIWEHRNEKLPGPQETSSQEAFEYIKAHTPVDAVIAFRRPRALALYAERKSISNQVNQDLGEIERKFTMEGVNYYLIHSEISEPALQEYVKKHSDKLVKEWENDKFILYRNIK